MDIVIGDTVVHKIAGIPSPAEVLEVKTSGNVVIRPEGGQQTYLVRAVSLSIVPAVGEVGDEEENPGFFPRQVPSGDPLNSEEREERRRNFPSLGRW